MSSVGSPLTGPTNRTIDDNYGDVVTGATPTYSDDWNYGPECPGCYVQPDVGETFDHSWHDVTASPSDPGPRNVTISFTGTAVWVYGVVPNFVEYTTTFVNVSFELDGKVVGRYTHVPSAEVDYEYNVTLYSNTSLANVQHKLVMTPQREPNASYMAFDWAKYTYEDVVSSSSATAATSGTVSHTLAGATGSGEASGPSPTGVATSSQQTSRRTPVAAIAGGVVGGICFLGLFAFVFICHRRRHGGLDRIRILRGSGEDRADIEPATHVDPFIASSMRQANVPRATAGMPSAAVTISTFLQTANAPSTINSDDDPSTSSSGTRTAVEGSHKKGASSTSVYVLPMDTPGASRAALAFPPANNASQIPPNTDTAVSVASRRAHSTRRATKASVRREELSRQVRDIESVVADLQRRQSSQSARTVLTPSSAGGKPVPPLPGSPPPDNDDSELRRQIEALQLEVERLRTEQDVLLREPPPAYVYEEDEET